MPDNPLVMAADHNPALLPLLRQNPALASEQDEYGYSLFHAAASWKNLELLRALKNEFELDVNQVFDEDKETALFVVETVEAAKVLVEELGADTKYKSPEGYTAREKIEEDGEYPEVVEYLKSKEPTSESTPSINRLNGAENGTNGVSLPEGLRVSMNALTPAEANEGEPDPELRRRIEELAARDDFHTEAGQAELRRLVEEVVGGSNTENRNVRARQE